MLFGIWVKEKRLEISDKEEGEQLKGWVAWVADSDLREEQTVLSTPAAFREALCQH